MEKLPTKQKLALIVGGVALVGVILFPASLLTLGVGVALGYQGCRQHMGKKEGAKR